MSDDAVTADAKRETPAPERAAPEAAAPEAAAPEVAAPEVAAPEVAAPETAGAEAAAPETPPDVPALETVAADETVGADGIEAAEDAGPDATDGEDPDGEDADGEDAEAAAPAPAALPEPVPMPLDATVLRGVVEALIFASPEPLAEKAIADRLPSGSDLAALLAELASDYATRGIRLAKIGDAWCFRTAPELAPHLRLERKVTRKLSRAALEALGIVAYHQPVTRAEVEDIRGVALSRGTLDTLMEAGWIRPGKRRRTPGKPVTWVTTQEFLDHFGLEKIEDLPGLDELKASGLLDTSPRVHVLQPGVSDGDGPGEEPEGEEAEPLLPDEAEPSAEDDDTRPPGRARD